MFSKAKSENPAHPKKAALIGNPNVGKSLIFGALTKRYVTVSNYPGTTVEITSGEMKIGTETISLIDTPGVNSLTPTSEDERVVRDILLQDDINFIIQVIDAKNLERGLYITTQIAEMGLPLLIVLNMMDEAQQRGIDINIPKLSQKLGIPIVPTVAIERKGIEGIKKELENSSIPQLRVSYSQAIEGMLEEMKKILSNPHFSRFIGLSFVSGDCSMGEDIISRIPKEKLNSIARLDPFSNLGSREYPISYFIGLKRLDLAKEIVQNVSTTSFKSDNRALDVLGRTSTHPVFGVPILILILYLAYLFVGKLGAGTFVDFLEVTVFEGHINPFFKMVIPKIIPFKILIDFLVGDFGIITMALTYSLAIIFPVICTFFIFFSILEDSGYLPRLAIMVDRVFKLMGLNGKVILPMVLGLGCDTMATLTTRMLETKKERLVVIFLLALGIPCSAQLAVVFAMASTLPQWGIFFWGGEICFVLFAVGFLASYFVKGESRDLIIEVPPIRIPQIGNVIIKTVARLEWYLKEAVPLFILGTIILFVLDRLKVLGFLQNLASPIVVKFLDLPKEATNAFLIGFLRRDYGAAGLFDLQQSGYLSSHQVLVSLVTITLFVPCVANFLIIIKEQGLRTALIIVGIVLFIAIIVGGMTNWILWSLGI
jgi:ferrous iron transport protein B